LVPEKQGNNGVLDVLRGPDRGLQLHESEYYETLKVKELLVCLAERAIPKKAMGKDQIVAAIAAWDLAEKRHRRQSALCYRVQLVDEAKVATCEGNQMSISFDQEQWGASDDETSCVDSSAFRDDDSKRGSDDKDTHVDVEHQSFERSSVKRTVKRSVSQPSKFVDSAAACDDDDDDDEEDDGENDYKKISGWDGKRAIELEKGAVVDDDEKPVYADENGKTVATLFELFKKEVARLHEQTTYCRRLLAEPHCQQFESLKTIWKKMKEGLAKMLDHEDCLKDRDIVATGLNAISAFIRGRNSF
jgi:hypothetical protein